MTMKLFKSFQMCVTACLVLSKHVTAIRPTSAQKLEDAPQCVIHCLDSLMDKSMSLSANGKRLCHEKELDEIVTICVQNGCGARHFLDFLKIKQIACGRPEINHGYEIRVTSFTILGIAVFSVAVRIVTKVNRYTQWGADDSLIIISLVCTTFQCIVLNLMTSKGLGRNIWTLDNGNITSFFIYILIGEYAYIINLCLIKLSILCFFLRIFPSPGFRRTAKWTICFTILTTAIISICAVCYRRPIWLLWEGWENPHHGVVMDLQAIVLAHAGINVALDVWMLILPLTQVYSLGLKPKKKAEVIVIFSFGIFLLVVSCFRIPSILGLNKSLNVTAHSQGTAVWSNIEPGVGVMVACIPHAKSLLGAFMERIKFMKILSNGSSSTEGIFVDRSLETINLTQSDRTTKKPVDGSELPDRVGQLSLDEHNIATEEDRRSSGSLSPPGT